MLRIITTYIALFFAWQATAQEGASCATAVPVTLGVHTAPSDNYWYLFTAPATGSYIVQTCSLSTCDTKLWAYSVCEGLLTDEGALNTLAYNDDACELQSRITINVSLGQSYWIRVGDYNDLCAGQEVVWELIEGTLIPTIECENGEAEVAIVIVPDNYPAEISWNLRTSDGTLLANGTSQGTVVCVPEGDCLVFTINDSYGDGIFSPGGYWVYYNGQLIGTGYNYGFSAQEEMNCPPGYSCGSAVPVTGGSHVAPHSNYWYTFVPDENGMYLVSTCTETCDTRLWIYDHCMNLMWDDTQVGSIYFNDNNEECGWQARINAIMEGGRTYYIRVGSNGDNCMDIDWSLNYSGPIIGCMDPTACNYDPLASESDDSCIYFGDPACPNGPDLTVRSDVLQNSIQLATINVGPTDCYIAEGCLNGYGVREIVRFTTHIQNIGNTDYYIGNPQTNPDQFNLVNCHGHVHYEGYAEYILYDMTGQEVVNGFKNGFCVMDLECSMGGTGQYGCGTMGISSMCGDIYSSGLACQWVDITDVPEGQYTLVVRTNWDNSPDGLGRYETDINNNWAQACLFIDRTPTLAVTLSLDCQPYVDCLGNIFGSAQYDCNGNCNGQALIGDLNSDGQQDLNDVNEYVFGIMGDDISPWPCNDIDQDGNITVSDAAFIAFCNYWTTYNHTPDSNAVHDHCNFPFVEIINPFDSVWFTLGDVNMTDGWLDILIKNPNKKLVGYELMMDGIQITDVENLYDPVNYPITPAFAFGGGHLMGLSYVDSLIQKNTAFVPLCRVHFVNPASTICISEVIDVVNENYMNSTTYLVDPCATFTGVSTSAAEEGVRVHPNPFRDQTVLMYPHASDGPASLVLMDLQGREVRRYDGVTSGRVVIDRGGLARGAYLYRLTGPVQASGRLLVD
jgi:hypothetical protein